MKNKIDSFRADVQDDMDEFNEKIDGLSTKMDSSSERYFRDSKLNVAIRDLPYTEQESIVEKVTGFICDGINIH